MKNKTRIYILEIVTTSLLILQIVVLLGLSKYALLKVIGDSMEPTMYDGSLCLVERVDDATLLEPGEIVVYDNPEVWGENHMVVHRIVYADKNLFQTKGDNNAGIDPGYINKEDIIFKVIKIFN